MGHNREVTLRQAKLPTMGTSQFNLEQRETAGALEEIPLTKRLMLRITRCKGSSTSSRRNPWGSPPSKLSKQSTCTDSGDSLAIVQFASGNGRPGQEIRKAGGGELDSSRNKMPFTRRINPSKLKQTSATDLLQQFERDTDSSARQSHSGPSTTQCHSQGPTRGCS